MICIKIRWSVILFFLTSKYLIEVNEHTEWQDDVIFFVSIAKASYMLNAKSSRSFDMHFIVD